MKAADEVIRGIQVHELACHHEAVLNPLPASLIAGRVQQKLAIEQGQWPLAGLPVVELAAAVCD